MLSLGFSGKLLPFQVILSQLREYVPMKCEKMAMHVPCTGDTEEVYSESLHNLLVGGDNSQQKESEGHID